jgi:acyl-CoA reductase-like NAD-dependent aldehyde dehydrogenase
MYNWNQKNIDLIELVTADLIKTLKKNKEDFFELNRKCTQDTSYWINHDWNYTIEYLKTYASNNKKILVEKRKPKGNILLILSFNEPLLLAIIPVLSALFAGNSVKIRPSKRNIEIVKNIWIKSGIVNKYDLALEIIDNPDPDEIKKQVKLVNTVYFFGSHTVAKKMAKICASNFVEFYPEIEAADCKIINYKNASKFDFKKDVRNTLNESFSHAGQICQRIHGVVVVGDIFERYAEEMKKAFTKFNNDFEKHISKDFVADQKYLEFVGGQIAKSKPKEVIQNYKNKNKLPILIISPDKKSTFIKGAYFLPTLWLLKVTDANEALDFLNSKCYYLGLNIASDDRVFIEKIVENTRFSRYTLNTSHINVRFNEGWGGSWPSGYSGYQNWLHHFSNPYVKIRS